MAKIESYGGNKVNDPPDSVEESAKSLKNGEYQMETPLKQKVHFSSERSKGKRGKPVTRTKSDSAYSKFGKRGGFFRKSLQLSHKKQKEEPIILVKESSTLPEEKNPEEVNPCVEQKLLEVRGSYSLPEIPSIPFSVMEINKLIEAEDIEMGYVHLLSLRLEIQQYLRCQEGCSIDLVNKEKDLSLLYGRLRNKLSDIVRSKEPLVYVAHIILEEEKRQNEPGAMQGWRESWKEAIQDGVRDLVKKVPLESREQNVSWLAVHLGLLGKALVEDLEKVKLELVNLYTPDFNVFETYVSCHHEAVTEHVKDLLEKVTELKDYHALLDFLFHRYPSEKIMGSSSLQPELKEDQRALPLDIDFINSLKMKYCSRSKADMRTSLDRVIELEKEEMWLQERKPEIDEGVYSSHIDMDIWTSIKGHVQASSRIDANLEQKVICCSLEELKSFPKRFESAFIEWSSPRSGSCLWAEYHISYINSFSALNYKASCPVQLEQVGREIDGLTGRLGHSLMERYKKDVMPFLRRQMTGKWFSFDEDFSQLMSRTRTLSDQTKYMSSKNKVAFVEEAHFFVVKEYISQLMKNNYSCKNRRNETAASKITKQWENIKGVFREMDSTSDWLHPVGNQLSKIIGCKKREVKDNLKPLVETYPDFKKCHLAAVLYFRGIVRGREKHLILERLARLTQTLGDSGNKEQALFSQIQAAINTECLPWNPFSCLASILPDR
ncbi:hypothetical protein DNTS_030032 [Danionella cerebrum]|uniref:Exocyst complex component Sec6 n=1 Tax=Danionella cerebrum TaxID=2873325 RepID=A0A553NRU7_9TELE|nr:hypothetical protein DNTS_030032 [Danionella translucida]